MDELQACFLNKRLAKLPRSNAVRQSYAKLYSSLLSDISTIRLPVVRDFDEHAFHQFVIRIVDTSRDEVEERLKNEGINWGVHYKTPCHMQNYLADRSIVPFDLPFTEKVCDEILSLPIHDALTTTEIHEVSRVLGELF